MSCFCAFHYVAVLAAILKCIYLHELLNYFRAAVRLNLSVIHLLRVVSQNLDNGLIRNFLAIPASLNLNLDS